MEKIEKIENVIADVLRVVKSKTVQEDQNQKITPQKARKPQKNPYHNTDTTIFKLVVWYSHRKTGEAFTRSEIINQENRKYHDSKDIRLTDKGYATRHDLSEQKLLNHIGMYRDKIICAWYFCNDIKENKQYLIGKFNKDENFDEWIQPEYITPNGIDVIYSHLLAKPLAIYKLRKQKINKNSQK